MLKHKVGDVVWVRAVVEYVDKESKYCPYKIDFGDDLLLWISSDVAMVKDSEIVYTNSEEFVFGDNVIVTIGYDTVEGKFVTETDTVLEGHRVAVLVNGNIRHYPKEYVSHG